MPTGSPTLQSGLVTPGHITQWVTDGVIGDAGVSVTNTYGEFTSSLVGINFNSPNTDYPVPINLPVGATRYRIHMIIISGATANLSAATVGVFTQPGAAGVAVVTSGTAVTVTSGTADAVNSLQTFTINNQNTTAWVDLALFFRVQTAAGLIANANVTVIYEPLP